MLWSMLPAPSLSEPSVAAARTCITYPGHGVVYTMLTCKSKDTQYPHLYLHTYPHLQVWIDFAPSLHDTHFLQRGTHTLIADVYRIDSIATYMLN